MRRTRPEHLYVNLKGYKPKNSSGIARPTLAPSRRAIEDSLAYMPSSDATTRPSPMPGHVLLVDDEPAVLRSLERILMRAGLRVTSAGDGRAALDALVKD